MWAEHKLTMTFTTPLCGGVPRHGDIVDDWVRARAATEAGLKTLEAQSKVQTLDEVATEHKATTDILSDEIDEETAKVWVGFSRDEKGLFIRGANIRAHLKDCATVLARAIGQEKNELCPQVKRFASKFKNAIYVADDRVHLLDGEGKIYQAATDHREATMQVMTARGPRTCLKRVDYCEPATLVATIQLLNASTEITKRHIELCLEYGAVHGFGQDRSLQFGRYTWTLE